MLKKKNDHKKHDICYKKIDANIAAADDSILLILPMIVAYLSLGKQNCGMEKMSASDSIISIGEGAECEECEELFGINIPSLPPAEWPGCCIYRVPKKLCKVNEEAYTPLS